MRKRPLIAVSIGMAFTGISYGLVTVLGFNSTSFMSLAYLYILLSIVLALYYELHRSFGDIKSVLKNFAIVVEEDEKKLRRVFTGEKYKIKGKVEKI